MRALVFVLALVSCEGRCSEEAAAFDTLGPGVNCEGNRNRTYCVGEGSVYSCRMDGMFFLVAQCQLLGDIVPRAEKP